MAGVINVSGVIFFSFSLSKEKCLISGYVALNLALRVFGGYVGGVGLGLGST